ncbi:structural protein [Staphylococcus phage vB_SauH_DELF3]|nr:structural protein [Staphylococcus phage vB_SauH_DELF3]
MCSPIMYTIKGDLITFMTLHGEEKALLEGKNKYTPFTGSKKCNAEKDYFVGASDESCVPVADIDKEARVSMCLTYTVLNFYKGSKKHKNTRVAKCVKHITNDRNSLQALIKDYQIMDLHGLYKKYTIHKIGLYDSLDLYNLERKPRDKDRAFQDTIEVE